MIDMGIDYDEEERREPILKAPQWVLMLAMGSGLGGLGSWGVNNISDHSHVDESEFDAVMEGISNKISAIEKMIEELKKELDSGDSREHNEIFVCQFLLEELRTEMNDHYKGHGNEKEKE